MTRKASILFILLLIFQSVASGFGVAGPTSAEGTQASIFTDISITDEENQPIEKESIENGENVWLHISWSTEGVGLEAAQTYSMFSPETVSVEKDQTGTMKVDDEEVGTFYASTGGEITVVLDDGLEEDSNASGVFVVEAVYVDEKRADDDNAIDESTDAKNSNEDPDEASQAEAGLAGNKAEKSGKNDANNDAIETDAVGKNDADVSESGKAAGNEIAKTEEIEDRDFSTFEEIEENIFTFESLTLNDEKIEDGSIIDFSDGTKVQIEFAWDTEGFNVQEGNTASMQLPDAFEQVSISKRDIITSGIKVGTYIIDEGKLIFTFNENIEDGDVSNGVVGLNLDFNLKKFEENIEQVIEFNDSVGTEINVLARPVNTADGVTKEGHPDQKHNASEITWTVEVMNNSDEAVTDATLSDVLPDGLGTPGNFVVTELSTGLNGSKVVGDLVDISPNNIGENTFDFAFDNIKPYQGYRVQYTTAVEDRDATEFTNDATFFDGETELPAAATVKGLSASNPVEKSGGYNDETGQIDWTIVANENGFNIDNAIITDDLPTGLSVDEDTLTVEKYVDGAKDESFTLDVNNFPIELGETFANEHYIINFSTDIDYEQVNEGEYQEANSFTNMATLKDGDEELGEDDATVSIERDPILEKMEAGNVDYANRTITWEVTVNNAKHPLSDVTVTDILPAGLLLDKSDIEITGDEGKDFSDVNPSIDATNDGENDGKTKLTINLTDVGTETITIKYTTNIDDFESTSFTNTVGMTGDGVGEGGKDREVTINPNANTYSKSFKEIDYNAKTINWQLKVNPVREDINSGFVITDTFTNDGLILLPDTVNIELGDTELTEEEGDYTVAPIEDGYQNGFTITFNQAIADGELVVNFTTSYDPQLKVDDNVLIPHSNGEENELYRNKVEFEGTTENGTNIDEEDDASERVREDSWNSGYKEGQIVYEDSDGNIVNNNEWQSGSERKIAWQLYTNYQQQNLGNGVVITDTLEYAGEIDVNSIRISEYDVGSDGATTITNDVTNSLDYTLEVDDDEFTLTFNQVVSERYVVEFLTKVPNISQETYTNGATVTVGEEEYPYEGKVNYDKHDKFLDKSAIGQEGSNVYIGDKLNWEIQVNESLSVIQNPIITDTISDGMEYVEGTLEISTASGSSLIEERDYWLTNTKNDNDETELSIVLNDTLSEMLTLNYTTVVTAEDGATVNNNVALNGDNIENVTVESKELTAEQFSWVDGEFNENRGALSIVKLDSETEELIVGNPATFELYYELNGERVLFADEIETNENGEVTIGNLPLRTYYIQEVEAPTGYIIDEEELEIDVTEPYGTNENVYNVEFSNTIKKTDIAVTKNWEDENDQDGKRSEFIEVQLLAGGEPVGDEEETVTLSGANKWTKTWTDLDAYHSNGNAIDYTIEEVNVPEGYESSTEVAEDGSVTITNSHEPEKTEIAVNKEWKDEENQDGNRPNNVTVNLLADGLIEASTVLDEDNDWQFEFTNLPVYQNGDKIEYKITENSVTGYSTSVDSIGTEEEPAYTITNNYTPEETSVTVAKSWNDDNNRDGNRPAEIQLQLVANGDPHGDPVTVNQSNWTYTWSNLAANENGEQIEYTVEEINVQEGYEASVINDNHGNIMITNSYEPETTEVAVGKEWDDADNQDGNRPSNVTVNLLGNNEVVKTTVLDSENDWNHTFTNLPVNENGEEITYRVTENNVEGYSTSIDADPDNENEFVITNSYTPEETTATVTKAWNDADNQDGIRPEVIEVQLLANGEATEDPVEIGAEDGWAYTWKGLPLNADGEPINYSVEELNVPEGYETTVNDEDHGNLILTNAHTPEEIDINGTKTWNDADNQDGIRPTTITVNLFANDDLVGSVDVTAADEWIYSFEDLPKFEAGEEITYTITEDEVEGYETELDEFDITNTHTPEVIDVNGTKTWDDADNQDGIRPDTITVNLLADGEQVNSTEVTEDDDWEYNFTDLSKFKAGEEVVYTVTENTVGDYTQTIDGFDITNKYTPSETAVTVTKDWDDANNQDGIRPETIEVKLTADEEDQGDPVELSEDNNWTHTWTELDEKAAGETIVYSVIEVTELPEYEMTIDDKNHGNIIITNSYTPETTEVTGKKTWDDADNQDGIRSESITVNLLANGDEIESVEVTAENGWNYSFDNLPKYEAGEEITYTITEDEIEGYEPEINDFDITNTHTPEVIEVNGTKTWDDADNQDGIRPESITVNLHANGEQIGSVEITAENGWKYSFNNLPKYEAGEEITYTITEEPVEGYETVIEAFNITNSYTPETIEINGTKTWDDADNQDGNRPESITVNLLANGKQVDSIEVTAQNGWDYSFTDLPKNEAGEKVTYTVTENTVADYTQTIDGFNITNHYTPGQTAVTVTKNWDDANNQDSIRSEAIEVQLTADGENKGEPVELSEANNWTHTWTELDEMTAGETIDYSVLELTEVPGYETTVDDADHGNIIITNAYTPEVTEISGTKTWDDDNQDGTRPESITVNLLANGEQVQSVEVTEGDNWEYSFTDLPKYEAGEEIKYTITENAVKGYETSVNGYDITNTFISNEVAGPDQEKDSDTPKNNDDKDTPDTSKDSSSDGDPLPETATDIYNYLLAGFMLMAIGFGLFILSRRRRYM